MIAEERGLRVTESKARAPQDFTSLVEAVVRNEQNERPGRRHALQVREQRIVTIYPYRSGGRAPRPLLIVRNDDRPGRRRAVGAFLGDYNINIAQLYLSRNKAGARRRRSIRSTARSTPLRSTNYRSRPA